MERAEKELMIKFRNNRDDRMENNVEQQKPDMTKYSTLDGNENSSHEEDDQPEGTSPTDNFFNKEYKKMMEEEPRVETTIPKEDKETGKETISNQEEEEDTPSPEEDKNNDPPQPQAETSPTPPPSKRQKMKQPTRKTTRSPKLQGEHHHQIL